jgi:hypothetical protein
MTAVFSGSVYCSWCPVASWWNVHPGAGRNLSAYAMDASPAGFTEQQWT